MREPLRVLHVVVAGEIGGAERMLIDLAGVPDSGAQHRVALMTPNPALAELFRTAGLDLCDYGRVRDDPAGFLARAFGGRAAAWLAALLRRSRARIVHLHTFGSQVVGTRAARRARLPIVRTEHSTRVFDHPACWPFSRWSLGHCARAVCVSAAVARVAAARAPWVEPRLRVIRNGVDLARFAPSPPPPAGGPLSLALVGRLEPRKGVDLALRALARVADARLAIAGDGPSRAALVRLAGDLGLGNRVTFHGHLNDVRGAVSRAQAVVCSSRSEGLGVALLEAMALGRPVIGFRVGGVAEIVHHERTGLVTDDASPDALAALLARADRDRTRLVELGRAARAWVEAHASSRAMCEAYGRVYAELAAAPEHRVAPP